MLSASLEVCTCDGGWLFWQELKRGLDEDLFGVYFVTLIFTILQNLRHLRVTKGLRSYGILSGLSKKAQEAAEK